MNFLAKYWMPTSMTWWTGIAMLLSGILELLAATHFPALAFLQPIFDSIWQGTPAPALVIAGLTTIGLRSAVAGAVEKILETVIVKTAPK